VVKDPRYEVLLRKYGLDTDTSQRPRTE
jgi:hypothetical protein